MVYDDYNMTYEELLASQSGIFIHQKHLKHLDIKVYKSLTNLNPEFMWPLFKNKYIRYNLRNGNICILPLYFHFTCMIVPLRYKFSTVLR